jgi:hypothetical protein
VRTVNPLVGGDARTAAAEAVAVETATVATVAAAAAATSAIAAVTDRRAWVQRVVIEVVVLEGDKYPVLLFLQDYFPQTPT